MNGFKDNSFAGSALVFFPENFISGFPKNFFRKYFPEHFEKKFPEFFRIFPEKIRKKSGP
jgi:predicted amidohydrolase